MNTRPRPVTAWLILAAACLPAGCRRTPTEIPWTHSLSAAKAEAASDKKLIIVDLFTDWCGWCKEMDRNTWPDPAVVGLSTRHVFLKLNAETDPDGIELQKRFGVQSYPTVLLLDSGGGEFERLAGYLPAPQFLEKLRTTLADPEALGNLKVRERAELDNLELRHKVGERLYGRGSYAEAGARFEAVAERDPGNRSRLADSALFYLALCRANERETDGAVAALERLRRTFPASVWTPKASLLEGEILLRIGRKDAARSRVEEFLKRYPDHQMVDEAKKLLSEM